MSTKLIAFFGAKGCGKSTACSFLMQSFEVERVKFAEPLKDMLRAIGLEEEQIEGSDKEAPSALLCGKTPRHAMQTLGTEWGRKCIGEDLWVSLWRERAIEAMNDGFSVVNDDLRFGNEAQAVRQLGGTLVRVYGRSEEKDSHESEAHYDKLPFDYVIHNRGTIEDLHSALEELLRDLDSGDAAQYGR